MRAMRQTDRGAVTALLARNPAAHAGLESFRGVIALLERLTKAGATTRQPCWPPRR